MGGLTAKSRSSCGHQCSHRLGSWPDDTLPDEPVMKTCLRDNVGPFARKARKSSGKVPPKKSARNGQGWSLSRLSGMS